MRVLNKIFGGLRWNMFMRSGLWHDPDPCSLCGCKLLYVIEKDGELLIQCSACEVRQTSGR